VAGRCCGSSPDAKNVQAERLVLRGDAMAMTLLGLRDIARRPRLFRSPRVRQRALKISVACPFRLADDERGLVSDRIGSGREREVV
jgi:hypothetical protein